MTSNRLRPRVEVFLSSISNTLSPIPSHPIASFLSSSLSTSPNLSPSLTTREVSGLSQLLSGFNQKDSFCCLKRILFWSTLTSFAALRSNRDDVIKALSCGGNSSEISVCQREEEAKREEEDMMEITLMEETGSERGEEKEEREEGVNEILSLLQYATPILKRKRSISDDLERQTKRKVFVIVICSLKIGRKYEISF
jgi:hypothetical protein